MAFKELTYTRDWTEPSHFPRFVDDERTVREDLQFHPNAVKDYINNVLLKELSGSGGAGNIGDSMEGNIAATLASMAARMETMASDILDVTIGDTPEAIRAVEYAFEADDWIWDETGSFYALWIAPAVHKRTGPGFGYTLKMWDGNILRTGTWATAGTGLWYSEDTGYIVLISGGTYKGSIVFFGV